MKGSSVSGQEFVIGGYRPADPTVESLLVGFHKGSDLFLAEKVRAGLTASSGARRPVKRCPFVSLPNSAGRRHWSEGITDADMTMLPWVRPVLVVQVAFVEWTRDILLRHPRFVGLKDDKAPGDACDAAKGGYFTPIVRLSDVSSFSSPKRLMFQAPQTAYTLRGSESSNSV